MDRETRIFSEIILNVAKRISNIVANCLRNFQQKNIEKSLRKRNNFDLFFPVIMIYTVYIIDKKTNITFWKHEGLRMMVKGEWDDDE